VLEAGIAWRTAMIRPVLSVLLLVAARGRTGAALIYHDKPDAVLFGPAEARFVRLVIQASEGGECSPIHASVMCSVPNATG